MHPSVCLQVSTAPSTAKKPWASLGLFKGRIFFEELSCSIHIDPTKVHLLTLAQLFLLGKNISTKSSPFLGSKTCNCLFDLGRYTVTKTIVLRSFEVLNIHPNVVFSLEGRTLSQKSHLIHEATFVAPFLSTKVNKQYRHQCDWFF